MSAMILSDAFNTFYRYIDTFHANQIDKESVVSTLKCTFSVYGLSC